MRPTKCHRFRQNNHPGAVGRGFADPLRGASQVGRFVAAFDEHLNQGELEGSPLHRAQ